MLVIQDINNKTFDLLTLKVLSESRVTWATSVPILVFLGISVLELGPMYATDRRQTDRRQTKASFNASALWQLIHPLLQSNVKKIPIKSFKNSSICIVIRITTKI